MEDKKNSALRQENIPALMEKHHGKIDRAIGYDSDTQQKRLVLFEHDPAKMAAHYPELQKKSEELREENLSVKHTASIAGWVALTGTAIATGYAASKNKISENKLIQGLAVTLSSITAGLAANFTADWLLGSKVRKESADLALASRKAYEQELAVYMEDTEGKIAARALNKKLPVITDAMEDSDKRWAEGMVRKTVEEALQSATPPVATAPHLAEPASGSAKDRQWAEEKLKKVITEALSNNPPQGYTASVNQARQNEQKQTATV